MNLNGLANLLIAEQPSLSFTVIEAGVQNKAAQEPFHRLISSFPGSRLIRFETNSRLCEKLNAESGEGFEYYAQTIGAEDGVTTYYHTVHPMCCSQLAPNQRIVELYNAMDYQRVNLSSEVQTLTLDTFMEVHSISHIDCIKVDAQGAELGILKGSLNALATTVMVVAGVEFIQLYENQPLFGDVCSFLSQQDMMFHKFLGVHGRVLKPMVLNNDPTSPSQLMWSDAVFIPDLLSTEPMEDEKLLKSAAATYAYGCTDVSYYLLNQYDSRHTGTDLAPQFLKLHNASTA